MEIFDRGLGTKVLRVKLCVFDFPWVNTLFQGRDTFPPPRPDPELHLEDDYRVPGGLSFSCFGQTEGPLSVTQSYYTTKGFPDTKFLFVDDEQVEGTGPFPPSPLGTARPIPWVEPEPPPTLLPHPLVHDEGTPAHGGTGKTPTLLLFRSPSETGGRKTSVSFVRGLPAPTGPYGSSREEREAWEVGR